MPLLCLKRAAGPTSRRSMKPFFAVPEVLLNMS